MTARVTVFLLGLGLVACSAGGGGSPGTSGSSGGMAGQAGEGGTSQTPWNGGSGGAEGGLSCLPGSWACSGNVYYLCAEDGKSREQETACPQACSPELGCVVCLPGTRSCEGTVSRVCLSDGSGWYSARDCAEWDSKCGTSGYCDDACGQAERTDSYIGCDYWPTPLANTSELNSSAFDYRVIVGNPNAVAAHVVVTKGDEVQWEENVPPGGLSEIALPWISGQSFGLPSDNWKSIIVADGAYRLRSNQPVTVAQFNPFEYSSGEEFSYTNDATILLPTHVFTGDYINLTYVPLSVGSGSSGVPTPPSFTKYTNYLAVVGVSPEPTKVRVHVSSHTAEEKSNRFGAAGPLGWVEFTLARGEVAHVAAAPPPNCQAGRPGHTREEDCFLNICDFLDACYEHEHDMTGSRVIADRPVQVFGGHVCAYVPYNSQACDHLEVQVPPIQTWGKQYVSRPMTDGAVSGQNLVRVVAAFDGTEITVEPPQSGVHKVTLDANRWVEFMATSAYSVSGTHAIMVGQFLLGQSFPKPEAKRGDPAMTVIVPYEQHRKDYIFVTPSSYTTEKNGQNYVLIIRPPGTELTLDGSPVNIAWESVAGREVGVLAVDGGTHTMTSTSTFGLIAYGLGSYTSYAYPAGLNLTKITDVVK